MKANEISNRKMNSSMVYVCMYVYAINTHIFNYKYTHIFTEIHGRKNNLKLQIRSLLSKQHVIFSHFI